MKLFLDTNVLIDFLMERSAFYDAAASLVSCAAESQFEICVSALTVVTASYVCIERSKMPVETFRMKMDFLRHFMIVTPIDSFVVDNAYNAAWEDFEDSIQFYSALCVGSDYIVTRNVRDFERATIPVLSPDDACDLVLGDFQ